MKELYVPVVVPNFEIIQNQLKNCLLARAETSLSPFAYTIPRDDVHSVSPLLVDWVESRSLKEVLHYRIYVTPPHTRLPPHIDGGGDKPIVPFRLNIPIRGAENTKLSFYATPDSNKRIEKPTDYLSSLHPIDVSKLKILKSLEVTTPHFINTGVMHGVKNNTSNYRVMFAVTWSAAGGDYTEIEEAFNVD